MRQIIVGAALALGLGVGFTAGIPSAEAARLPEPSAAACTEFKCSQICTDRGYDYGSCSSGSCVCYFLP